MKMLELRYPTVEALGPTYSATNAITLYTPCWLALLQLLVRICAVSYVRMYVCICCTHATCQAMHYAMPLKMLLFLHTVCALIFVRFNVCSFCGLAAIRKSLVHENLDINGYARNNSQHSRN